MDAVVTYLDRVAPAAGAQARQRYACFDHVRGEGPDYGHAVALDLMVPCEDEVVAQLLDLRTRSGELLRADGLAERDEYFFAEVNARVVCDAERYYRAMYRGRVASWNLRDRHMASTAEALLGHLSNPDRQSKLVIWAHNSHVGDARATELGVRGELTLGQLLRDRWRDEAVLIGFTTESGTVTAASEWGGPAECMRVRPAPPGSWEATFHQVPHDGFLLRTADRPGWQETVRMERAIGVIYRPRTERESHWFHARLAKQFDAVIHLDTTTAVEPLERTSLWDRGEAPETYPSGL